MILWWELFHLAPAIEDGVIEWFQYSLSVPCSAFLWPGKTKKPAAHTFLAAVFVLEAHSQPTPTQTGKLPKTFPLKWVYFPCLGLTSIPPSHYSIMPGHRFSISARETHADHSVINVYRDQMYPWVHWGREEIGEWLRAGRWHFSFFLTEACGLFETGLFIMYFFTFNSRALFLFLFWSKLLIFHSFTWSLSKSWAGNAAAWVCITVQEIRHQIPGAPWQLGTLQTSQAAPGKWECSWFSISCEHTTGSGRSRHGITKQGISLLTLSFPCPKASMQKILRLTQLLFTELKAMLRHRSSLFGPTST